MKFALRNWFKYTKKKEAMEFSLKISIEVNFVKQIHYSKKIWSKFFGIANFKLILLTQFFLNARTYEVIAPILTHK